MSDDSAIDVDSPSESGEAQRCPLPMRYIDGTIRDDYMELFCPARVVPELAKRGWRAFLSIDITDASGWDLTTGHGRAMAMFEIERRRPKVLLVCAPCKMFSKPMHMWNIKKMDRQVVADETVKSDVMFELAS